MQTQNGDITGPAEVRVTPTEVKIELPTDACYNYRMFLQDGADVTLIEGGGCRGVGGPGTVPDSPAAPASADKIAAFVSARLTQSGAVFALLIVGGVG